MGRAYLAFCDREGITPGGLVEASMLEDRDLLEPRFRYMADRLRDSHDLWHVVTGYRTDLLGENAVLAFTAAQTDSVGVGVLAAAATSAPTGCAPRSTAPAASSCAPRGSGASAPRGCPPWSSRSCSISRSRPCARASAWAPPPTYAPLFAHELLTAAA